MSVKRSKRRWYGLGATALAAAFAFPLETFADPPAPQSPLRTEQQRAEEETELRGVEESLRSSDEQRRVIESEIESIRADRARLTAALIDSTAKVHDAERSVAAADERLRSLNAKADALSRSLDGRRGAVAEVLAALERMGVNPPPAILVKPGDMAEAVRGATVLGSMIPAMRAEMEALLLDIVNLSKTREMIVRERDEMARTQASLALEKTRLSALVEARQKSLASAEDALDSQQKRAVDLARQATTIKDLIARLDAEQARRAAAQAAEEQSARDIAAKAKDARGEQPRLTPDVGFAATKGRVPLPVAGTFLRTFGSPDGFGGVEHGVSVATLAAAVVSAPADGSVLFSGPYRTYGQLLIISAGGGYYLLLAGMERINVTPGEFVLSGEPVGSMGGGPVRMAAAAAVGVAQPVLYIELRKDGTAIDPGPWWAKSDIEKARG